MEKLSYELLTERHEQVLAAIRTMTNHSLSKDLRRMSRACDNCRTELSKESIQCRKYRRETIKYQELLQQYSTCLQVLEEYVTFGVLLDG